MIKSPLHSIGSKYFLIKKNNLCEYFPIIKDRHITTPRDIIHHYIYVEMFSGSCVMFFNLEPIPSSVILNDKDDNIFNFWNVIKKKYEEFNSELKYTWNGDKWVNDLIDKKDDISKAILFYLKNVKSDSFRKNRVMNYLEKDFTIWKKIMDSTKLQIWNRDFKDVFKEINKSKFDINDHSTRYIIYEDPPYYGTEYLFSSKFLDKDHRDLYKLNCIANDLNHIIFITYNDNPLIRELYSKWNIIEIEGFSRMKKESYDELFISNLPLTRKNKNEKLGIQQKVI